MATTTKELLKKLVESSALVERFSVDINPETLRWEYSFNKLSDSEFESIIVATMHLPVGTKFNTPATDPKDGRSVGVVNLDDGAAQDFARALARRLPRRRTKVRTKAP